MLTSDERKITQKSIKDYQSFVEEKEDTLDYQPQTDMFGNEQFRTKLIRKSKRKT